MLSLYNPGYPQTPDSPSSATQVLNLWACALPYDFSWLFDHVTIHG